MRRVVALRLSGIQLALWAAVASAALMTEPAPAQQAEPVPDELRGAGITEKPGANVPIDAEFVDEAGQQVTLGTYAQTGRPILLALVYYRCPMLCGLALNGVMEMLEQSPMEAGKDFELLAVSFDPSEGPELARAKKQGYAKQYPSLKGLGGVHFLTGQEDQIQALSEAVGFSYQWNQKQRQFAHGSALIALTPDGRVSRYMHGIVYDPKQVKAAVQEAKAGRITTEEKADQTDRSGFLWTCFQYLASENAENSRILLRLAGVLTVVVLLAILVPAWLRSARRTTINTSPRND